jgi:hypothetical protein
MLEHGEAAHEVSGYAQMCGVMNISLDKGKRRISHACVAKHVSVLIESNVWMGGTEKVRHPPCTAAALDDGLDRKLSLEC